MGRRKSATSVEVYVYFENPHDRKTRVSKYDSGLSKLGAELLLALLGAGQKSPGGVPAKIRVPCIIV